MQVVDALRWTLGGMLEVRIIVQLEEKTLVQSPHVNAPIWDVLYVLFLYGYWMPVGGLGLLPVNWALDLSQNFWLLPP